MHEVQTAAWIDSTWRPGVGRLYFSSGRFVMFGPWSPTPCWLVLKFWLFLHESAWLYCFNARSGCDRLFSFSTVQILAHHRVNRDARSRDRERGLSKLSGVDVHVSTSRSDRLLFLYSDCGSATAQRGPTAKRPCWSRNGWSSWLCFYMYSTAKSALLCHLSHLHLSCTSAKKAFLGHWVMLCSPVEESSCGPLN